MDLSMDLGTLEILIGLGVLLIIAPLLQFWTLKLGLNGMREDVREIKATQQTMLTKIQEIATECAVHDQRLSSLESRMKRAES